MPEPQQVPMLEPGSSIDAFWKTLEFERKGKHSDMTTPTLFAKDFAKERATVHCLHLIILAAVILIAWTGNTCAIEAKTHSRITPMQGDAPSFRVERSTLMAFDGALVRTEDGSFRLDAKTRLYLQNGGTIKRVDDLSPYIGSPVQLKTEDGRAVWIVVETREAIR
jgi:hypothetical protein